METLELSARRVLTLQAILAVALGMLVLGGTLLVTGRADSGAAGAVLYGSLLGMLTTLVNARSVIKSSAAVAGNPHLGLLPVFSGLVWKLIIVAGGAYAGLAHLGLGPLYLVIGYMAMQVGYLRTAFGSTDPQVKQDP